MYDLCFAFLLAASVIWLCSHAADPYQKTDFGYDIGELSDLKNKGIKGHVYFVDNTHILIKGFKYTYPAPDMYFWLQKGGKFTSDGVKVPAPRSGEKPLDHDYNAVDVSLELPKGKGGLKDFDVFGMYCLSYSVDFGDVKYDKDRLPF